MQIARTIVAAGSLAIVIACGGSSSNGGTIAGQPVTLHDAASKLETIGGGSAAAVLITTADNTCSLFTARQQLKNGQALVLGMAVVNGASVTAPAPGTYTVYAPSSTSASGNVGIAEFLTTNASCNATTYDAASGTITLSRADAAGYTGTYDITFANSAGRVTGNFTTANCAALDDTGPFTCPP
jgi:hypothetical protein